MICAGSASYLRSLQLFVPDRDVTGLLTCLLAVQDYNTPPLAYSWVRYLLPRASNEAGF